MSADTNPGGWPDPTKLGVPLNSERDGTHWLWISQATGALMAFQWHAPPSPDRVGAWINISREITTSHPLDAVRMGLTYCAPCLTPSEIAAREAAAWIAGRDAAASEIDDPHDDSEMRSYARFFIEQIRALPLPDAAQAALDAVVREAREEGYRSGFFDGYEDGEKDAIRARREVGHE